MFKKSMLKSIWLSVIFSICFSFTLHAEIKRIAIVKDNSSSFTNQFEAELKREISDILNVRYTIKFLSYDGNNDNALINKYFEEIYNNNEINLVISIGVSSSNLLHNFDTYPKPSIATMVMEVEPKEVSGINNYTYETPIKSSSEIVAYFSKMYNLQTIGIPVNLSWAKDKITKLKGGDVNLLTFDINTDLIPKDIDGILLLPQAFDTEKEAQLLIEKANKNGIPTLSIQKTFLKYNCTAAINYDHIVLPLIKKTALNTLYILEGKNASNLKIQKTTEDISLILNMQGVKKIKKLPNWSFVENAELINVAKNYEANPLSLTEAIAIGLQDKLSLKKSALQIDKADEDVSQSYGNLTPSISADVQSVWLSDNIVEAYMGRLGKTTVTGNIKLQQILFSDPVITNIAIKKLVQENVTEQNRQNILDDVVVITQAYISVLLAKTNLVLQNRNLNVTKSNLTVAESKEKLGFSKQSDVSRLVSELNLNKIQLSSAMANYKKALYSLNEVLNQDVSTEYNFPDSIDIKEALKFPEEIVTPYIRNEFLTEVLSDFYLKEMQENSPELSQLLTSEEIVDRKISTKQREFFLPQVVGFASISDIFLFDGAVLDPNLPVPPIPEDLTWNIGVGISIPILDRRERSTDLQKYKIDKEILRYTKQEVKNTLESRIRTQVQQFKASHLSYKFAVKASDAADKNYLQVEEAYKKGFITITQLLEAQSAKFNANLLVVQTNYKEVLDYLMLERLTGKIQLLNTEAEQKEYINRLQTYLIRRE